MSESRFELLREALPYIQRFKGKTFVVKLSGKATEDADNLASLAEELALLHQVGIRLAVVHGGGKQLSDLASRLGVEQTIINGRRVTDDATLEMAKMIVSVRCAISIASSSSARLEVSSPSVMTTITRRPVTPRIFSSHMRQMAS